MQLHSLYGWPLPARPFPGQPWSCDEKWARHQARVPNLVGGRLISLLVPLFAGSALLFVLLAIPMIRRRVPLNGLYGLRVPATFADEWVWYEANARSGLDLLVLGLLLLVLALGLPLIDLPDATYALVWSGAAGVGALVMTAVGWRRANRLLHERERGSDQTD